MGDGLVQIAYLHPHRVSHSWHESMMRLIAHDAGGAGRIVGTNGPFMISSGAGEVAANRNLAAQRFLDETEHEWLWFVDTDMGFLPDAVDRLIQAADPAERPIVGALCFAMRQIAYDGYGGRKVRPVPVMFMPARDANGTVGFTERWRYPENTVVQVAGTGAACLLIHRSVLEKMRVEVGDEWFSPVQYGDRTPISEDLSFCARAGSMGLPIFVHTGVKTTHHKEVWLSADDYEQPPEPVVPASA